MVATQSFDPLDFLQLADSLVTEDSSEAILRTAVGRVYYTVFLVARESLQVQGRSRIHGRVIGELRRRDRFAGDQLDKLEELRGIADYQLDVSDPLNSDWQNNYRKARRLATFVLERLT